MARYIVFDEEKLREAISRMPSPHPRLLMRLSNDRGARLETDVTTEYAYEEAYFEAARKLSASASTGTRADQDLLPILYLYRHFIELMLKSCIACLAVHARAQDTLSPIKVPTHHKLIPLLDLVRGLHRKTASSLAGLALPSKQAQDFIKELGGLDEDSVAFRYLHERDSSERTLPQDLAINLEVLDAGMLHVQRELTAYRDMLDQSIEIYGNY